MELSQNDYINFIDLNNSIWGLLTLSLLFIIIAQLRPLWALSLMCVYPTIPWSASYKPIITLYPVYPLVLFFCFKYLKEIIRAVFANRYSFVIMLSCLIIIWSFLSTLLYPASYGPPISFSQNPNFQRGVLLLAVLLFLPALLRSRYDIRRFLFSTTNLLMAIHILIVIVAVFYLMSGHYLYDLHLMRLLETPPIFWESGLLLLCLAYFFVLSEMNTGLLIVFATLACAGLILGNSRTRFLSTIFCLLYFLYPYVSKRMIALIVSLVLFLSLSPLALPDNVNDYFSRLINQRIKQSSSNNLSQITAGRTEMYEFAFKRWTENPMLGVGSCYILPRKATINQQSMGAPRVHNYYLEVLAGQGAVGFGLLIIVVGMCIIMTLRIAILKADKAVDGRLIVALFFFGIINWAAKESWGITYCAIALLSMYMRTRESAPQEQCEG